MLKAKESKTASSSSGGRRKKHNTHVRFFLPSSPSSSSSPPVPGGVISDPSSSAPSSTSSYAPSRFASSSFSTSSSLASTPSSSSPGGPPRRPPPLAPSTLRSLTYSSSPSSSASSLPTSSAPATSTRSTLSSSTSSAPSSSRVRLPPSSFSYLAPAAAASSSSASSASHLRRASIGPGSSSSSSASSASSSSAFFVPPPRPAVAPASAFTSSSSFASLPGSRGWNRYRSALDRASATTGDATIAAGAAQPPARRPSPTPPTWRDDTDVSGDSDSDGVDNVDDHGPADIGHGLRARHASAGDASVRLSADNPEGLAGSGQSSPSSFSIESLPSLSSPTSSLGTSSPTRSAVTPPAAATTVRRPSPQPPVAAPRPSFGCARPFAGVTDADSVADALRAWLIPDEPEDDNASFHRPKAKTTKVRLGVEIGRLNEAPRCSVRVAHLTGSEGRKARQWAEVGHDSVAISVAFVVKDGVDVFELGELSGSIKNLLLLAGSDEIDTALESKLVEEGPDASKILLLNLLFRDACLFDALSAVLAHHRVEQAEASLLLSHGPGDCRVRRARNDGLDARLTVDAVLGRSVLRFVEAFLANRQREAAAREKERRENERDKERSEDESESESGQQRRQSSARTRRASREEKRRAAGALFRRYGRQMLGLELPAGLHYEDRAARLVCLLRALNDLRFFVEFDSLDALLQRLWPGDVDTNNDTGDNDESEKKSKKKKKSKKNQKGEEEEPKKKQKKKKDTKDKKKEKRMSADSKRLDRERRESKTKSADAPRVRRGTAGPDVIASAVSTDDHDDVTKKDDTAGGVRRNNWHALHEYLCASYGQLVAQTVTRTHTHNDDDDGDDDDANRAAEARREIEEGIVAGVRDMLVRLQSLCAVHSLRFIVGDHVLHVACEGLALFDVLPSRDEMAAIERRARRDHKKSTKKKNDTNKKRNDEKKPQQHSASRKSQTADVEQAPASLPKSSRNAKHEPPRRDDVSSRDELMTSAAATSLRPTPPPKRDKSSIKIMVLGDLRVGKTSLIQRFMKGAAFVLPAKYKPTYAADFVHKNVSLLGKPRTLQIWDTSGNERQRAPDRAFFKGVDALVLVFDQRRASTFVHALDRHLDDFLAHAACPDPRRLPVVVVGNRCGGGGGGEAVEAGEREVTRGEVEAWCRDRIEGNRHFVYVEANAKDGANVDAAFLHAAHAVLDLYHQSSG